MEESVSSGQSPPIRKQIQTAWQPALTLPSEEPLGWGQQEGLCLPAPAPPYCQKGGAGRGVVEAPLTQPQAKEFQPLSSPVRQKLELHRQEKPSWHRDAETLPRGAVGQGRGMCWSSKEVEAAIPACAEATPRCGPRVQQGRTSTYNRRNGLLFPCRKRTLKTSLSLQSCDVAVRRAWAGAAAMLEPRGVREAGKVIHPSSAQRLLLPHPKE